MRIRTFLAIGFVSLVVVPVWADDAKNEDGKQAVAGARAEATHKQARVVVPKHDGEKIALNTFCLSPTGDLLLCVGGPSVEYLPKPDSPGEYEIKRVKSDAFVQIYSPDEKLLREIKLDFKPTAINMIPGAHEFVVAGDGWIARMTLDGKVITKSRTPNVGNFEEFKVQALKEAKAQFQEATAQFEQQVKTAEKKLAKLLETPEEDRSKSVKARIEAQQTLIKQNKDQIAMFEENFGVNDPDTIVNDKLTITAVAATPKDIFISASKLKGHGYDVWRTTHEFTEGEKVVEDLGGCCGQMDIQALADNLVIAENGKFQVGIYERDGELTKSFGKRDRKSNEGFGSCCNPMNVRCCADGTILTAESSIGDIKRFASDGKFLGYIGRAKIGGGCKHVAVEFDTARNRYYMQHQDKGHICVLVPAAEITGPTEDELQAKAAREGLGAKLVGSWSMPGDKKAKKKSTGLARAVFGEQNAQIPAEQLTFGENGELTATGGMLAMYSQNVSLEWVAIQQTDKQLTVGVVMDGVENFNFKVTFNADETLKIDLCNDDNLMSTAAYQRGPKSPTKVDENVKPASNNE